MCGLFFYAEKNKKLQKNILIDLIKLSEKRGLDNTGVCFKSSAISIIKKNILQKKIYQNKEFNLKLLNLNDYSFGQCRLVTDGPRYKAEFNQPIITSKFIGLHNGIILNDITDTYSENVLSDNDTIKFYNEMTDLYESFEKIKNYIYNQIGIINLIFYDKLLDKLIFFSNNGSLYFYKDKDRVLVSSEEYFLKKIKKKFNLQGIIKKFKLNELFYYDEKLIEVLPINLDFEAQTLSKSLVIEQISSNSDKIYNLKKCVKCILPSTYPLIKFDNSGICNYCNNYIKQTFKGDEQLISILGNKDTKILYGLSGGRDSTYGLYYLIEVLGYKNITTYTYDWGLTTDSARRNISYFCYKYKVENILRSAHITNKRYYIKKNFLAWLKKPNLGMVPLFFIGDKPFLYYGTNIQKQTNSNIVIHGTGFQCEQMEFKIAYCGIKQVLKNNVRMYDFGKYNKIKLFLWYFLEFLKNPFYLNSSLLDNIFGFYCSFLHKDSALHLYNYVNYDSKEIKKKLKDLGYIENKNYGDNQWRVGDGHTAFVNFIYYQLGGFSEFDNYRSNQIREGYISREDGIKLAAADNIPKLQDIDYFCRSVGLNTEDTLLKILNIKTLY